jgi:hypothetical protein
MHIICTATDTSLRTICIGNPQQLDAFFMRKRMQRSCHVLKLMAGAVHIHTCTKYHLFIHGLGSVP